MSQRKRMLPRGWYPFDGKECKREIESYIEEWSIPDSVPDEGLGGIVPHAGWYFSGRLAARVLYSLKMGKPGRSGKKFDVIVLYGGHMGPNDPPRVISETTCETPLGDVAIHQEFLGTLLKKIEMTKEPPSVGDNTIEIQLTMIRYFFPDTKLIAIRPPLSQRAIVLGKEIAQAASDEGLSVLSIGSTDLTHYGPNYGLLTKGIGADALNWVKKVNDKGFIDRAVAMDAEGVIDHAVKNDSSCSPGAAASVIAACQTLGAKRGMLLDYYTSYDIMHDDSFVGYAGILF